MTVLEGEVIDAGTEVELRVDVLREQTVAVQERSVTMMLTEARQRLQAATTLSTIIDAKALGHTLAEVVKQLRLGRDMRLDADEFMRRAERLLGLAIREGQARGEIRRQGQVGPGRANQFGACEEHVEHMIFARPTDYASTTELSGAGRSRGIYAMTDNVTDEVFEWALAEGRREGNLSRAAIARACYTPDAPVASEDPVLPTATGPVRRTTVARRTVEHMAVAINAIALGLVDLDPAEVDAEAQRVEIDQLKSDVRKIAHFLGRVSK